jgi:integrase
MRVYKRKGSRSWQAEYYENGERVQKSTRCHDKKAAEARARQWERDAADPLSAALRDATLRDSLEDWIRSRSELAAQKKRSADTIAYYQRKAGMLLAVMGEISLSSVTSQSVAEYVSARRKHLSRQLTKDDAKLLDQGKLPVERLPAPVSDHTIFKEVSLLGATLRLAKKRRKWRGDVEEILPARGELAPEYEPRKRWLTEGELQLLLSKLEPDRHAQVAFMVALGAERGAVQRARREDISPDLGLVLVRGTKRPTRWREVPIVHEMQRRLLLAVLEHAQGDGAIASRDANALVAGPLFTPWGNMWRDISAACTRAGIEHASPNDFRRSFGHWLRARGVVPATIGAVMGHVDSTMAERVYARLSPLELGAVIRAEIRIATPPATTATTVSQTDSQRPDSADSSDERPAQIQRENGSEQCRQSDLNRRPWDYDSDAVPLIPRPKTPRSVRPSRDLSRLPAKRGG